MWSTCGSASRIGIKEYDWREQERQLNQFDDFKATIDDLDIHFIHQRSPEETALLLLILHGWPGSIVEFMKMIGPLTNPVAHGSQAADAFDVVAPSLPGYRFSERPRVPGMGPEQIADINAQANGAAITATGRRVATGVPSSAGGSPTTTPHMSRDSISTS